MTTTTAPTHARRPGGNVQHVLDGTSEDFSRTLCGQDARLMARYRMADLPSGERTTRTCERCRTLARPHNA